MIKYEDTFKDAMPAGFDGVFDWDFLIPIFKGTKITPMDIDCIVERRGHTLMLETKNAGVPVPLGQAITLETQIKYSRGKTTVYIIYGKTVEAIEGMEEWYYHRGRVCKQTIQCNSIYVYTMVEAWFSRANGNN